MSEVMGAPEVTEDSFNKTYRGFLERDVTRRLKYRWPIVCFRDEGRDAIFVALTS